MTTGAVVSVPELNHPGVRRPGTGGWYYRSDVDSFTKAGILSSYEHLIGPLPCSA